MKWFATGWFCVIVFVFFVAAAFADAPAFAPVDQWKDAVVSGNSVALKQLYSSSPAAHVENPQGIIDTDADVAFWVGLKAGQMKLTLLQSDAADPKTQQILLQAEVLSKAPAHTVYVTERQLWQQQDGVWRIIALKRTNAAKLQQPVSVADKIYPQVDAHSEIQQALAEAAKQHKRVIVVFGADWCYDCHVLDLAFKRPDIAPVLNKNFEVVHIDVGQGDKNQDLMDKYEVPMKKGIPGLAVLDSSGKLLYSQKNGEFEKARVLGPDDLLAFLNQWKPVAR